MGLRWSSCLLLLTATVALPVAAADITDIVVEVTADRSFYEPGEEVAAVVTQCNPTDEVISQVYACPGCHDLYSVLNADGEVVSMCGLGGILVVVTRTWQPGECKTRNFTWDQLSPYCDFGDPVANGVYRLQHDFVFAHIDEPMTTLGPEVVIGSAPIGIPSLSTYGLATMSVVLMLAAIFALARQRRL